MSDTRLFRLGADVGCTDGECGKLKSVVVSPGDVVTHLVVEPTHRHVLGRLVPLHLVDTAPAGSGKGEVRLGCTVAEFGRLDPAEATYFTSDIEDFDARHAESNAAWPYYAPPGVMGRPEEPEAAPEAITVDTVPDQLPGEDEVSRGEQVHATDADIGHVQGIGVDPATGRVTFVYLRTGHLFRRKELLVPRSAVADVGADGFHLNITTEQVQNLGQAPG
jgi:hypothetical protein